MKFTLIRSLLIVFLFISAFLSELHAQSAIRQSIRFNGQNRSYLVYIPSQYRVGSSYPLVLVLHGLTQTGQIIMDVSGFNQIAENNNFIAVYPDGINRNWDVEFIFQIGPGQDDVGFLSALVDSISARYSVDSTRVYSCGFSNGGFMSYRLACERSDKFAAIAGVGGTMTPSVFNNCTPIRPVPVLQIHGTLDGIVYYPGSLVNKSVDDVLDFWRQNNVCPSSPVVTRRPDINRLDLSTVDEIAYSPCGAATAVNLLRVNGGGHQWPGTRSLLGGLGTINRDINASQEIWDFFSRFSLSICRAKAGTITAQSPATRCFFGLPTQLRATPDANAVVPNGFQTLYLLSVGTQQVIRQTSNNPQFFVTQPGLYTIHTLIFENSSLPSASIVLNQTTVQDIHQRLIQGGGVICGSLDRTGARFNVANPTAGTLRAVQNPVCLDNGRATIEAAVQIAPNIPTAYQQVFLLTSGLLRTIQDIQTQPVFQVNEAGIYSVHSFVYEPATFSLNNIQIGTTGLLGLNTQLVQGGGNQCAALQLIGTPVTVEDPQSGFLIPLQPLRCLGNSSQIALTAAPITAPNLPLGYLLSYVLTSGIGYTIEQISPIPLFSVSNPGVYRIHTLVYNPLTWSPLSIQTGSTSAFDVNRLFVQGGGNVCGDIDMLGASFFVLRSSRLCDVRSSILRTHEGETDQEIYERLEATQIPIQWNVYPNPCQGQCFLRWNQPIEHAQIEIIDVQGRVLVRDWIHNTTDFQMLLPANDLPQGAYLIRIQSEHGVDVQKWLKW